MVDQVYYVRYWHRMYKEVWFGLVRALEKIDMSEQEYMTFDQWWHVAGSGIQPNINDDMETHAKHVASIAWKAAQSIIQRELMRKRA